MTRPMAAALVGCGGVHLVAVISLVGLAGWWWLAGGLAAVAVPAAAVIAARSRNAQHG